MKNEDIRYCINRFIAIHHQKCTLAEDELTDELKRCFGKKFVRAGGRHPTR